MGWALRRIAYTIIFTVLCWQSSLAQVYHQLTIHDFEGIPRSHNGVIAYTNCTIDFRYQAVRTKRGYRLNFDIRLILNRNKSWMDKSRITSREMLASILKHEQGHYIVAYLEQQELIREVAQTQFEADYQRKAQEIFDRIDAKYKQLNHDYDEDTAHMTNNVQQNSWDAYFQKRLRLIARDEEN